jgi:hypothetical protein
MSTLMIRRNLNDNSVSLLQAGKADHNHPGRGHFLRSADPYREEEP